MAVSTVHRRLVRLGISRLQDLDSCGATNRVVRRVHASHPGHMVPIDIKKIGAIPDGGGWRAHGRGSAGHKASARQKVGYRYWHTAIDGYSRLAYTEALADEKGATAAAFWGRARAFFAAHGIGRIDRVITDDGACHLSKDLATAPGEHTEHRRTRPYRPQTNGKVER